MNSCVSTGHRDCGVRLAEAFHTRPLLWRQRLGAANSGTLSSTPNHRSNHARRRTTDYWGGTGQADECRATGGHPERGSEPCPHATAEGKADVLMHVAEPIGLPGPERGERGERLGEDAARTVVHGAHKATDTQGERDGNAADGQIGEHPRVTTVETDRMATAERTARGASSRGKMEGDLLWGDDGRIEVEADEVGDEGRQAQSTLLGRSGTPESWCYPWSTSNHASAKVCQSRFLMRQCGQLT